MKRKALGGNIKSNSTAAADEMYHHAFLHQVAENTRLSRK